ncbi:MAG: NAD(P)/FAD-dependent oxidoreductase, partial [Sphingomonadaceae bacterium]|nr:NAD(P)/FAD-dependent oxidoreductase [Sphingomonadaceae bacterium]
MPDTTAPDFDVIIVGAGFAGMYLLHKMRGLGKTARILEQGDGVGGTWYWNRYPGARCDIESMEYSYSWSGELEQDWTWSERYSTQPEILDYANHVADRFDLKRDIEFGTRVVSAHYDEAANLWTVGSDD